MGSGLAGGGHVTHGHFDSGDAALKTTEGCWAAE